MPLFRCMVTQDNDQLPFVSLAALTANVLRYLEPHKKQNKETADERERGNAGEKNSDSHAEAVNHRLRELRAFERRAAGIQDGLGRQRRE